MGSMVPAPCSSASSASPSSQIRSVSPGASAQRLGATTPASSPGSPCDKNAVSADVDVVDIDEPVDAPGTGEDCNALNMSVNTATDMRTNSIATLRIKAKEHLESISKGLTMV